jgi:excinuclease UvrABC ATPase subunit
MNLRHRVSGSGKSTLVNDTSYRLTAQYINKTGENPPRSPREGASSTSTTDRHLGRIRSASTHAQQSRLRTAAG